MGQLPWIYDRCHNVTSQNGEDGLLEAVFEKIGTENKICVEIGSHDGKFISNSWHWINNHDWSAVLVEADPERFKSLIKRYPDNAKVSLVNEWVTKENGIDQILARLGTPLDFDYLSIDIDGMDYHLWKQMEIYKPRVVCIEINCSMDTDIDFVQNDPSEFFGTSAKSMVALAKEKGYELIAHLVNNVIFVRAEDLPALEIGDNSLERLFTSPFVPKVISDIRGVHHILKEGAWGFTGAIWYNDTKPREKSMEAAERFIKAEQTETSWAAVRDPERGYEASITPSKNMKKVLMEYVAQMKKSFAERFREGN